MRAKEHIAAADALREKMLSPEWRECESREDERITRFGRHTADCMLGVGDDGSLSPSTCATCPIPAKDELIAKLVEAARAGKTFEDDAVAAVKAWRRVAETADSDDQWPGLNERAIEAETLAGIGSEEFLSKCNAALAAYEAAEKEVGGDPVQG